MAKKIVVLTGSPRVGGNTDALAEAFIKGAAEAGHEIKRIDTGRMDLWGCKMCHKCYTNPGEACVYPDDFSSIAPDLLAADAWVLAFPLYWFAMPAQLKAVLDKMNAFGGTPETSTKATESALIACGTAPEDQYFTAAVEIYKGLAKSKKWTDKGIVLAKAVTKPGDALNSPALAEAEALGRSF